FGELAFYPDVEKKINFVWGDITQLSHLLETVEKYHVDSVIHLASLRNEVVYKAYPAELFRVNIGGTQNLLELARLGKIKKIVFASSAAVYGKMEDPTRLIPEDAPQNPVGIYANSKAMCESLFRCYRNVYGVDGVAIRASRVWGRMANLETLEFGNPLSSFVYKVLKGQPICDKTGADFGGDFSYAPDVAYGFYRALVTPRPLHWIFNISPGKFYRLSEVAKILKEIFPKAEISVGPGMEPYVTQSPIRGALDIALAKEELSYRVRYDLREALEDFIGLVRERGGIKGPL
ncbi:MAG: NAD(P)-dependent oxidoreductase, partial [Deltaproteobacteria bacterium]